LVSRVSKKLRQLGKKNCLQSCGYRRRRSALTQFLDDFWDDFNGAIDLRASVEPAKRKAQTPSGAIAARIHCPQHVRSFL
jgi:hypothetical protein